MGECQALVEGRATGPATYHFITKLCGVVRLCGLLVEESNSKNSGRSKGLTKDKLDEYRRIMKADQEPPQRPMFEISGASRSNLDIVNDFTHLDHPDIEDVFDKRIYGRFELHRQERIATMIRLLARGVKEAQIYRRFTLTNTRETVADSLQVAKDWTHDCPIGWSELVKQEREKKK